VVILGNNHETIDDLIATAQTFAVRTKQRVAVRGWKPIANGSEWTYGMFRDTSFNPRTDPPW